MKKAHSIQYGYRKCEAQAQVFFQTLMFGNQAEAEEKVKNT